MSAVAAAVVGSAVIGGVVSSKAASKASKAQITAADRTAEEQRAAREQMRGLLSPYTAAGIPALQAQMNLLGFGPKTTNWGAYARSNPAIMRAYEAQLKPAPSATFGETPPATFGTIPFGGGFMDFGGTGERGDRIMGIGQFGERGYAADSIYNAPAGGMPATAFGEPAAPSITSLEDFAKNYYETTGLGAGDDISQFTIDPQQEAINQIEQGALFKSLAEQGENAILANASATGGLRGGNIQGAFMQFRPKLLNELINQQYERLGGLTALGQRSAAGVGANELTAASNIGQAYTSAGQAQAGSALAKANAINQGLGSVTGFLTSDAGTKALTKIGKAF
jgi:hypothetical protein